MTTNRELCPICFKNDANINQILDDNNGLKLHYKYSCKLCGNYHLPEPVYREKLNSLDQKKRAMISVFIRNQNLSGKEPCIKGQNPCGAGSTQYSLNEITSYYPNIISEVLDRALINMHRLTPGLGKPVAITENDYPVFYALDWQEFLFIKNTLESRGFIRTASINDKFGFNVEANGLLHLEQISRGVDSNQVFVAMWFDDIMNQAFNEGFAPAIKDVGLQPQLIKNKEFVGPIPDEIKAEIQRSKFVVADLTGNRQNVYYEAGYAHGLNIPVIFTCNKKWFEDNKPGFDIAHYNCIDWESYDDLKIRLYNRLRSLCGSARRSSIIVA